MLEACFFFSQMATRVGAYYYNTSFPAQEEMADSFAQWSLLLYLNQGVGQIWQQ